MECSIMIYDFAVIGAGSVGLSFAAAAAAFGETVILFEKGEMGGDCLNTGCIPSKTLLAVAKQTTPPVNYLKAMKHVKSVIATLAPHDSQDRFEKLGVKVIRKLAQFNGPRSVMADGQIYQARKFIIATGSRPAIPPIRGLADVPYFTTETIFKNRKLPNHLLIIGGGPVGLELAQAHHRLGARVTIIEAALPLAQDDPELAQVVIAALQAEGVDIRSHTAISEIRSTKSKINLILKSGEVISGSHILLATGRLPNIESLNLAAANITHTARGLNVSSSLRTSNKHVYAAGDVAGGLQFTHVANYHAGLIIRNAMFRLPVKNRTDIIPRVTYTDPELAHVGLNEQQARQAYGSEIKILRWPFAQNDRAVTEGKTQGLIKIITRSSNRILGASIVGAGGGELLAPWVLAINQGLKISAMANLVLPYPTYGEAGKRAAITAYAGLAQRPSVRRLLGFLKWLG
jgi:pyruvate/2-oxoglutarate dehydrogenase complex dihydrolipoamide dehydrogenase (E3) component